MNVAADNDYKTVLVLMKGTDADATIDALEASGQTINVKDEGPYWKLRSNDDIYVDMAAVEEELGIQRERGAAGEAALEEAQVPLGAHPHARAVLAADVAAEPRRAHGLAVVP